MTDDGMPAGFAPSSDFRSWRDAAQAEDGNAWEIGHCMLYCRRDATRVHWLGPVHAPGGIGAMYGCAQCVAELDHLVYAKSRIRDIPCSHPTTTKHNGKTHCRTCARQLYL